MFIYIIMCKSNYNAIADNLSINETDLINYPALYQHSVAMVNFVLNYLCRKVGEGFDAGLKIGGLPLHFYCPITLTFSGTSEQRKTAFFRIVGARFFDNFRVEHNRIRSFFINLKSQNKSAISDIQ